MGAMSGGDQDAWLWTISDEDATKFWTLELQGVPGRLTIADIGQVRYDAEGELAGFDRMLKIGSRDGAQPAVFERLLFEPGRYLIGIARSGGGSAFRPALDSMSFGDSGRDPEAPSTTATDAYRLIVRPDERVPESSGTSPTSRSTAKLLDANSEISTFIESEAAIWYRFDIAEDEATTLWDIVVRVPIGRTVEATLRDASGAKLVSVRSDVKGRLVMPSISRPAGPSFLDVRPILSSAEAPGFVTLVTVSESGKRVAGEESEPNDRWALANRAGSQDCCTGELSGRSDDDYFSYTVEESENLRALVVENPSGQSMTACLLDARGRNIQCRESTNTIRLSKLSLSAGEYGVKVTGRNAGTNYSIALESETPAESGHEVEPNDAMAMAIGTPDNNRIRGSFDSKEDVDFYRFTLSGDPQLWRIQAIGDGIGRLTYHDVTGTQKQSITSGRGQRRLLLDNLFLFPGTHLLSVAGSSAGDYTLLARPLGQPHPDHELEPNDDASRRMPLRIGQTRIGLLSDPRDIDQYRFHLAGWDHIRVTATPPVDGQLAAKLYLNNDLLLGAARDTVGTIELEGRFPPGDYQLVLEPLIPSDAEYTLSLKRVDAVECVADCEPNNNPVLANPMPRGGVITGIVGNWDDDDWFALPATLSDQPAAVRVESDEHVSVRLYDHRMNRIEVTEDRAASTYQGTLLAGQMMYLQISSARAQPYKLTLLTGDETEPPVVSANLNASASVTLDANTVAAYAPFGQRVTGDFAVTNNSGDALELTLDGSTSDIAWQIELDRAEVALPPGATGSIGLVVATPVDARADKPVRISVRAQTEDRAHIGAFADIAVHADAELVSPIRSWRIPVSLQGGLDVAHHRYGATLTANPAPRGDTKGQLEALIDGLSANGHGASFDVRRDAPLSLTVDLPGDDLIPVVGFGLNPLSRNSLNFAPALAELQLSTDGTTFYTVATTSVLPVGVDQYIALNRPVPATHARLFLEGAWTGEIGRRLTLGEVKVVAQPGYAPVGISQQNIAHPDNGGHVVWSDPPIGARWDIGVLTEAEDVSDYQVLEQQRPEWVIGFHHNRAAEIERITWRESADENVKLTDLTVSVSLDSPVGPWQSVAEWNRADTSDELILDEPTWARFVRFSAPATGELRDIDPPEFLAVYERSTGNEYRSVLSEWGFRNQSAWFEATQPLHTLEQRAGRANLSAASADPLRVGSVEVGSVRLGESSHWYHPVIPDGHNTMRIFLVGAPTVRSELVLRDTAGTPIPLHKLPYESTLERHVYEAYIESGRAPVLEVREPPRSVLFLWDTSGSVAALRPMIVNSVTSYAEDLVPGQDMANLQPFGSGGPILDKWYGEPYLMQMILNDYRSESDNSAAENNQRTAAKALANRPGTKAIMLITDAETPREPRVWEEFRRVQPRVFTLNVGEQEQSQDLMQDWASVNDGHYAFIQQEGDMEIAFERASAMLRKPAAYSLSMTTEQREPPGPGYVRVVSGGGGPARGAVELILDASGSMLQRMEGRRRIDIAKEVLTSAIRDRIPQGTPTALRVFGHQTPNACETDLEIPLEPLEPQSVINKIARIQAKNLARTPIAGSLSAVSRDLKGSVGPSLVVLVTDGEETCDGNPVAAITELAASGIDLNLNIVGFAIDDKQTADEFEMWATLGGGRYLAAHDAESLTDSIADALATPYAVLDSDGSVVAQGQIDGRPVEVTPGKYRVIVDSNPADALSADVVSGKTVELRIHE